MSDNETATNTDRLDVSIVQLDRLANDVLRNVDNFARDYGYCLFKGAALPIEAASELAFILQDSFSLVGTVRAIRRVIASEAAQKQPQPQKEILEPRN
jgi:hypothetical protein